MKRESYEQKLRDLRVLVAVYMGLRGCGCCVKCGIEQAELALGDALGVPRAPTTMTRNDGSTYEREAEPDWESVRG